MVDSVPFAASNPHHLAQGGHTPLPVLLLPVNGGVAARERTLRSLETQSVHVSVCAAVGDVPAVAEYVAVLVTGVSLDMTACERAVWFLAARPDVRCVTGAIAGVGDGGPCLESAIQFVVIRASSIRALLAPGDALHAATALALVIGVHRRDQRGAGWLSEPVIVEQVEAAVLTRLVAEAQSAVHALGVEIGALTDLRPSSLAMEPLQRLTCATRPGLRVQLAPASGMRVLALLQGFPMGGYTAFNADLLPRLSAAGHAVTTCTTEWWRTEWQLDRVRAVAPDIHHAHGIVPQSAVPAYIDWLIASRGIDVVLLSHSYLGFHLLPYLRARHPDVAFVDYVHTDWFERGMYGSYATMAARWESQLDAQLTTSHALTSELTSAGCDAAALHTAHIGIDTAAWTCSGPRLQAVRRSLGAATDTLVLLFSGRISPEKRPHLAVDVAAALVAEGRDVMLVFAGGGPLLHATHDRAAMRGLGERCKFLGEVDETTLRLIYAASDVFLAPSEIEGIARSLYEAMAMGCVPVVSDVGGQRELVVPGTGTLVPAARDDAALYVDGVRPWFDRAARAGASAAARAQIVAHFDAPRTVHTVGETLALACHRRQERQDVLPSAMAEELAVMSLEVIRRHAQQMAVAS